MRSQHQMMWWFLLMLFGLCVLLVLWEHNQYLRQQHETTRNHCHIDNKDELMWLAQSASKGKLSPLGMAVDLEKVTSDSSVHIHQGHVNFDGHMGWQCKRRIALTDFPDLNETALALEDNNDDEFKHHMQFITATKHKMLSAGVPLEHYNLIKAVITQACRVAVQTHGSCHTVEIGLAMGVSTVSFLRAHDTIAAETVGDEATTSVKVEKQKDSNPSPSSSSSLLSSPHLHISVDPGQLKLFSNVGKSGVVEYFKRNPHSAVDFYHMNETSDIAMSTFRKNEMCFDVIFIDGDHSFDTSLMELVIAIELATAGQVIMMHDIWLPGQKALVSYIEKNMNKWVRIAVHPRRLRAFMVLQKITDHVQHSDKAFVPFNGRGEYQFLLDRADEAAAKKDKN